MKILVTHPGKIGDCFWALATARAIAEAYGEPVDFMSSADFTTHLPLIQGQPYIARAGYCAEWRVQNTAPMTPATPPPQGKYVSFTSHRGVPEGLEFGEVPVEVTRDYDRVFHLGYPAWPTARLAEYVYQQAQAQNQEGPNKQPALWPLYLARPWITPPPRVADDANPDSPYGEISVGFTDEWGELKAGILLAVADKVTTREPDTSHVATDYVPVDEVVDYEVLAAPGTRWDKEFLTPLCELDNIHPQVGDWLKTAYIISKTRVFLGCLSSQAVLAMALGKPRVLVEPNPHRHHEIFQHPDVQLVRGTDGLPTFDARHVADALREALSRG